MPRKKEELGPAKPFVKKLPEIKCLDCKRSFRPANKFIRYCGDYCRGRATQGKEIVYSVVLK